MSMVRDTRIYYESFQDIIIVIIIIIKFHILSKSFS
jgi:hypothetical protein